MSLIASIVTIVSNPSRNLSSQIIFWPHPFHERVYGAGEGGGYNFRENGSRFRLGYMNTFMYMYNMHAWQLVKHILTCAHFIPCLLVKSPIFKCNLFIKPYYIHVSCFLNCLFIDIYIHAILLKILPCFFLIILL